MLRADIPDFIRCILSVAKRTFQATYVHMQIIFAD